MARCIPTTVASLSLLLALSTPSQSVDLHKCVDGDRITYSDRPCPGAEPPPPTPGATAPRAKNPHPIENPGAGRLRRVIHASAPESLVQSCLDLWRPRLKDPTSVIALSARIEQVTHRERPSLPPWQEVVIEARAKNSFGAYVGDTFVCGVNREGEADPDKTKTYHAMHTLGMEFFVGDHFAE